MSWSRALTFNWSVQVSKKARQQMGILYRKFYPFANTSSLLHLYLTYIHPHLPTSPIVL